MSHCKAISIWDDEPPWTASQVIESSFRDSIRTRAAINGLPGALVANAQEEVQFSLSIFLDSVDDLLDSINAFKGKVDRPGFWDRTKRQEFRQLETRMQRGIFSSSMSAMALVDHTRRFSEKFPVDEYENRKNQIFSNDPEHRFVHSMRRYVTHVKMTKGNWHIKSGREGKSVFFILSRDDLLQWKDWSAPARAYIEAHRDGVNVEELYDSYSRKVKLFHEWLSSEIWEKHHSELQKYFSTIRVYRAVGSRCSWNLLIRQVFQPKKINPYMYLGRYLEQNELEEVLAMPYRSTAQVDRIIEIVDDSGACDEELREHIHQFFQTRP